ncbi:MAG TPA: hypothetical protein DCQ06_10305, partial [Myxococcales bacterium]|nr:hypothetical protein [Myxococcales bacterium]
MTNLTIALACRQLIQDRQGRRVLRGVDLDLPVGTITVLLGANGAGKSTLLMTFAGQLPYKTGAVRIGDLMLSAQPVQSLSQLMYVPQRPPLEPCLSLREHADALVHLRGLQASTATQNLLRYATQMGLSNAVDRPVAALSGGMQQKCALCLGLLAETPVLLLDEPYAGL